MQPFLHPNDASYKIWSTLANWPQNVLITCKYKKNRIKNNREKVETSLYVYWKFKSPTIARNSEVTDSIQPERELVWDFIAVLVTSKFDEDPIKNERASLEKPFSH